MSCVQHRRYLAAMADGELDLVPATTVAHVRACQSCQSELRTQSLLTARLRAAVAPLPARPTPAPRGWWAAAAAAVLVAVMAVGLAVWRGLGSQDQVLAAASAAQARRSTVPRTGWRSQTGASAGRTGRSRSWRRQT